MDETVIFPSPNWFQVSILAVSKDGWLIYGGPSKGLCVLEPIQDDPGSKKENSFRAHVLNRAHLEKIISVDISPAWPEKKLFLTGSADGSVKQWGLEKVQGGTKIKALHLLDLHQIEKETLVSVAYSSESFVITVGTFGNIVKWDLRSNVAKTYKKFLAKFKPTCMACSPHVPLNVAVGTKQGVVFVLDLEAHGKILYKIRVQDHDIVNVSWCPQYQVVIKKSLQEKFVKKSNLAERLEQIRSEDNEQSLNDSGVVKSLPDDSFDETIVEEDDTFDIYKDHEADEFGHKKFEPEDIIVKVKVEKEPDDFLTECLKLKEDILKMKNECEQSVDNLAESLDNTHIDNEENTEGPSSEKTQPPTKTSSDSRTALSSHVQKHLLAVLGKHGGLKLVSKGGKIIGSGVVPKLHKTSFCTTVLWYAPDVLLCADGKSQLLQCNPLSIDCEKKLCFEVVHALHKRGLSCIATNAPRVQAAEPGVPPREQWRVWTVAQERSLICYSMESRRTVSVHNTAGSFLYTVHSCPYDARSIAISSGDGAVRVLETDTVDDDSKLSPGKVTLYWQNVQGKVLTLAWHPTKENLIAFSTAESRVGLIQAHGKTERPARTLAQAQLGAIYSLCWGDGHDLYASGNGKLVVYRADKPDEDPTPISVELDGKKLGLSSVCWDARGMVCGSVNGAVIVLEPRTRELLAATFAFSKMIHMADWHPLQTSSCSDESLYKDLIAVTSLDKSCAVAIMQYADKGDGLKLHKWKMLTGHKGPVLQVAWNPHKDAQLLSTSHDATVRVWDVTEGVCVAIFGGHEKTSLSAAWSAFPQLSSTVLSGGGDCCLRVWRVEDYPPQAYTELRHETCPKKKKAAIEGKEETEEKKEDQQDECDADVTDVATSVSNKSKASRMFLLPTVQRPIWRCTPETLRIMAAKYLNGENDQEIKSDIVANGDNAQETKSHENGVQNQEKECLKSVNGENGHEIDANESKSDDGMSTNEVLKPDDAASGGDTIDSEQDRKAEKVMSVEYWKLFGSTNEFNEILDLEMRRHEEHGRLEAWSMLAILRGHIDAVVQFASQRDALCPFLLSISPCVSFKYWKDVTQLYLAQMERLAAKGEEDKMNEVKAYGGSVFRRAALLLSVHDARGAAVALREARLFAEAYVLARARHMDSLAREVLQAWVVDSLRWGQYRTAAVCHLALGEPSNAAEVLAHLRKQPEFLGLAADLAKSVGQLTFAAHVEEKKSQLLSQTHDADTGAEENLKPLPSKIDLMRDTIEIQDAEDCETEEY